MTALPQKLLRPSTVLVAMENRKFQKLFGEIAEPDWQFDLYQLGDRQRAQSPGCVLLLDGDRDLDPELVRASNKIVVTLEHNDIPRMVEILHKHKNVRHVICLSGKDYRAQLIATLHQVNKNLAWQDVQPFTENELHKETFRRYSQKTNFLNYVHQYVAGLGSFKDLPATATTIASELIMNAAFDAPMDVATGQAKYAHLPRSQDLELLESEQFNVTYGYDGHYFIIAVRDPCGTLTREKIVSNLVRCAARSPNLVRKPPGGAGVGLFMLLNLCTRLDFYLSPNKSTQVVAYVVASKRQKDYEMRGSAINIFTAKGESHE